MPLPYPTQKRIFKDGISPGTGTPALGSTFNDEYVQLYANFASLGDEVNTDEVNEHTPGHGVDVEGVHHEDSVISLAGTPIAGYLNDGTPYYIKEVTVIVLSANTSGSVLHGINNAYTNDRIFNAVWRCDSGSYYRISTHVGDHDGIERIFWTNTHIALYRPTTGADKTFKVKIWYI